MKKKLLPLAIAAVMAPGFAAAADVSGFAVIDYTISDDSGEVAAAGSTPAHNTKEGKFGAVGELDFSASPADGVTVRMDVDLNLGLTSGDANNDGNADEDTVGASLEQAFFAWGATEGVTILGGVFNNPIGYEAEDKPDMDFNDHGAVYKALDSQTALDGDNVAGLAAAFAVGPATITAGLLNDLNHAHEENSIALVANMSPMEGLDLEVGLVTQTGNSGLGDTTPGAVNTSVGDATNFNVVYTGVENLTLGLDYLVGDEVLDSAYDIWAGYQVSKELSVGVRISEVDLNDGNVTTMVTALGATAVINAAEGVGLDAGDSETTAFNVTYKIASNLKASLEVASTDVTLLTNPSTSSDKTTLKLLASF